MPRYDFYNTETGELVEYTMSWRDLDDFKLNNPHLKQQVSAPQIVGGTGDRVKTDAGFKEVLSKVGAKFSTLRLTNDTTVNLSKISRQERLLKTCRHTEQKEVK